MSGGIGAALLVALLATTTAPSAAIAGSTQDATAAVLAAISQKSVLDDFDEEEEEPMGESPSGEKGEDTESSSNAEGAGERSSSESAESKDDSMSDDGGAASETPAAEGEPAPGKPADETPAPAADKKDEPAAGTPASKPPAQEEESGGNMAESPSGSPSSSPLDQEEEEAPLEGGGGSSPAPEETGKTPAAEDAEPSEAEAEPVCDEVLWRKTEFAPLQTLRVVLFRDYLDHKPTPSQRREIQKLPRYTERGKASFPITGWQIDKIIYYEERMGEKAAQLVGLTYGQLADPQRLLDVSDERIAEGAKLAEEILNTAIAEHDSAVQRRLRRGPEWKEKIRWPLVQARLNLRLSWLDQWIAEGAYQQAEGECDRLAVEVGADSAHLGQVFRRVEKLFKIRSEAALARQDYATVRQLLDQWGSRYPDALPQSMKAVQDDLVAQASELARRAESLRESSPHEALELLTQAAAIWPPLGQVDQLRRKMAEEYPILHVAYSELPRNMTPMTARSAVERHALSLLFESLVRWTDDPQSGAHYTCQLAAHRPEPLVRGRDFQLRRTNWSDSSDSILHYCTVEDIRRTVQVMRDPKCPGYSPAWSQLLEGVDNASNDDPFRAMVRLQRDHWQPLSLMAFPILPASSFRTVGSETLQDRVAKFSRQPVGTGPYRLAEAIDPDSPLVRFTANPYYRGSERPSIREIVFHRMDAIEAEEQFMSGKLQLIYGVQKEQVTRLTQADKDVRQLRTPTVTFLAPNYRSRVASNQNVRLAIAHAIDRTSILDQYFRPGGREDDHQKLTGPFPAGCWASDPGVPDFQPELARVYAAKARTELNDDTIGLRLAYPAGSLDIESACKRIAEDVRTKAGIAISLERLDSNRFYEQVTQYHNFDLAYWSHTFEDSTFWLEPLLDPNAAAREPGGPNFMGYAPDQDLATLFQELRRHKQFRQIEGLTHEIHKHVARTAVIVPLWQLDAYVAVSGQLGGVTLDPLTLYKDIQSWTIGSKPSY